MIYGNVSHAQVAPPPQNSLPANSQDGADCQKSNLQDIEIPRFPNPTDCVQDI